MKNKLIIIFVLILFVLVYLFQEKVFLPVDVLNNTPSFSESNWERPKNSLLADPIYQFEPWRQFAKREILSGRFPLWNDMNANGVPFFANFQSAVLYPLNLIYYLLPSQVALLIIPICKLLIMFYGTYKYLRQLKITNTASFIAAIGSTFSGFSILWLLWPHTNVYIFMPLVLFITEKIYSSRNYQHRYFVLLSFIYCTMIFGGHPETLLHVFIVHSLYVLFRFWKLYRYYLKFSASVLLGFGLGAIQIIPFLEYLLNSHALIDRSTTIKEHVLPIQSLIYNIFPYFLGAPQGEIYKPLSTSTNFQEVSGGYVGVIIVAFGLVALFKINKFHTRFWGFIILISVILSYKIWPFYLLSTFPLIRLSANHRLVAYLGFGLVILSAFAIERLKLNNKITSFLQRIPIVFFVSLATIIFLTYFIFITIDFDNWRISAYINTVSFGLFVFILSLIVCICALRFKAAMISRIIIGITILLQTAFLFWNYNPFVDKVNYYPETQLVKVLKSLPAGSYIEIGNPALPANVNMMYGLRNIQNYDAIEINSFKSSYDKVFNDKNSWGNPESISQQDAQKFNISYIISDYNINLSKDYIQTNSSYLLPEVVTAQPLTIDFKPIESYFLEQIRFKTATFNRSNNCNATIEIFEEKANVFTKSLVCQEFRNNMFYTVDVNKIFLDKNKNYLFKFSTDSNSSNSVSLYGNNKKIPYFETLYDKKLTKFDVVQKTKYTVIFSAFQSSKNIKYEESLIYITPTKIIYDIDLAKAEIFKVTQNYYPGWKVKINGEDKELIRSINNDSIQVALDKGKSIVEIYYDPISFKFGLAITFITLMIVLFFLVRIERSYLSKKFIRLYKELQQLTFKTGSRKIIQGMVVGVIISTCIFVVSIRQVKAPENEFTTAINWITTNNYPKKIDYIYFYGFFIFSLLGSIFAWFLQLLWTKIKK